MTRKEMHVADEAESAGNQHVEVDELSGLNHLFQTAKTELPNECGEIEETMCPVVLEKKANWILKSSTMSIPA